MARISSKFFSTRRLVQNNRNLKKQDAKLKPFGFCCSMDHFDPLTKYDQRRPPYTSTFTTTNSVHDGPTSKIQVEFVGPRSLSRQKGKIPKLKSVQAKKETLLLPDRPHYLQINGNHTIRWYLEDEIALAKDIFWMERQRIYNEEGKKRIITSKENYKSGMINLLKVKCPRWYQDLSPDQMKNLMNLENIMLADYEKMKTDGTETVLIAIGVIPTFLKLKPNIIKKLHISCNLNSIDFMQKIYKILTGNDFYEEEYKKLYNCNERIILSAIAFLTLPETIEELHKRLPAVIMPKFPPKPKLFIPPRLKSRCPYKEELFKCIDWRAHRNNLQKWRKQCKSLAIPKVILPLEKYGQLLINKRQGRDTCNAEYLQRSKEQTLQKDLITKSDLRDQQEICEEKDQLIEEKNSDMQNSAIFDVPRLPNESKKFDFTLKDLNEKREGIEYKTHASTTLKLPRAKYKSWLGEKDSHYIMGNVSEITSTCPATYEIIGIANVTPNNSDEKFFTVLGLSDSYKRDFPKGRENLSRNWQEWLQKADEDFRSAEKEANKLIANVETTKKLIFPAPTCDDCCSCRQTRETHKKLQEIKTPYLFIDNVIEDKDKNKYIVGSMAMHSPAPSLTETETNLLEVTASEDKIQTNIIINEVTCENGKTQYGISGVQKDKVHIPSKIIESAVSRIVRNVPPCACAIREMSNKNVNSSSGKNNVSLIKNEEKCVARKYRPKELDAYSCKWYPRDKSCKRNSFKKGIRKMEKTERKKQKNSVDDGEENGKMYNTADFQSYGDDNNISIVNGATDTLSRLNADKLVKQSTYRNTGISSKKDKIGKSLQKFSRNITTDGKGAKLISKVSTSTAISKMKKQRIETSLTDRSSERFRFNKIKKISKRSTVKRDKQRDIERQQLDERKREMARLKNMFKFPTISSNNAESTSFPVELQHQFKPEKRSEEISVPSVSVDEIDTGTGKGITYGSRTKSEQELPTKKTVAYLCEPDYPLETVAVRSGGRPCQCRENRSKKKMLMYNVGGFVDKNEDRDKRRGQNGKLKEENRIIDGVFYLTPPASPRRSDEYIPEYELSESPYDTCISESTEKRLKLTERYSGPKSLVEKITKRTKSCNCSDYADTLSNQRKVIMEARRKLIDSKSPEERRIIALKDAELMDYFTHKRDNIPCWTSCAKFNKNVKSRRLKVVKPVCECKYERKIVERNEDRTKWLERQRKLKSFEKQSYMHIVDTLRPTVTDNMSIVAEEERISRDNENDNEHVNDIEHFITDVAENHSTAPLTRIIDGLKMCTPAGTPEPSKQDIPQTDLHRHWSSTNIPAGSLPRRDAILEEELTRRQKVIDEAFNYIYGDRTDQHVSHLDYRCCQKACDQESLMENIKDYETKTSITNLVKPMPELVTKAHQVNKEVHHQKDLSLAKRKEISKAVHEKRNDFERITSSKISRRQDEQIIKKTEEKNNDDDKAYGGNGDNKYGDSELNLKAMMKAELEKMAEEGYIFAKLPECHLMPQLRYLLRNRKVHDFLSLQL